MIRSYGPPDNKTPGNVGDLYLDTKTDIMYSCVTVIPDMTKKENQFVTNYIHGPNSEYFWEKEQNAEFVVSDECKIFNAASSGSNTLNNLLSHIRVPEGIEVLGTGCFSGFTKLKTVYLPKSLITIEGGAFNNATSLKHITIPSGVRSIGGGAFSGSSIETIYIEDGLETVHPGGLFDMNQLKDIRLPNTLTTINSGGLSKNPSLTKIMIPNSVITIDSSVFNECDSLVEIVVDKPEGSITGAPWGAPDQGCKVTWLR